MLWASVSGQRRRQRSRLGPRVPGRRVPAAAPVAGEGPWQALAEPWRPRPLQARSHRPAGVSGSRPPSPQPASEPWSVPAAVGGQLLSISPAMTHGGRQGGSWMAGQGAERLAGSACKRPFDDRLYPSVGRHDPGDGPDLGPREPSVGRPAALALSWASVPGQHVWPKHPRPATFPNPCRASGRITNLGDSAPLSWLPTLPIPPGSAYNPTQPPAYGGDCCPLDHD